MAVTIRQVSTYLNCFVFLHKQHLVDSLVIIGTFNTSRQWRIYNTYNIITLKGATHLFGPALIGTAGKIEYNANPAIHFI